MQLPPPLTPALARRSPVARRRAVKRQLRLAVVLGIAPFGPLALPAEDGYAAERAEMVRVIEHYADQPGSAVVGGHLAPDVLHVMSVVPRHEFVPDRVK